LLLENYQITFLGGGKLGAIRIPDEPIGLKFISSDETENIIYTNRQFSIVKIKMMHFFLPSRKLHQH